MVEVGFLGIVTSIFTPSPSIVYITVIFLLFLLSMISTLLFFHVCYHACCLSWPQYFWSILGATAGVATVISPEAACSLDEKRILPVVFACSLLLYGMSFVVIASLKPSLAQHINESLRSISRALPGRQMALADRVARSQKECSDRPVSQYLRDLPSREQMNIAGTPLQICQRKGAIEASAFPQIQMIASSNLRREVARVFPYFNEENVDIGFYLLSKTFEDTLVSYLMIASAKGKLPTTPTGKSPNKLDWPEMMWCLKDCGIVLDATALSSLRDICQKRACGIMPSLEERQVLMKNVQLMTAFYIDAIKLIDDLTHALSIHAREKNPLLTRGSHATWEFFCK